MELYEAMERRRTVRDFENETVPTEALERIVAAALKAPTNDHMRDWQYVVVRDKAVMAKMIDTIPKEFSPESIEQLFIDWNLNDPLQRECYRRAVPKQYRMLLCASAIIVPLLKEKTDILHPKEMSHLNGFASIWCSIENILLAATAEGYGCSLRIPFEKDSVRAREVLGIPEDWFIPCFLGVGVPAKDAQYVKQHKIDPADRIHWDRY